MNVKIDNIERFKEQIADLDWEKGEGFIPAIIQNVDNGKVLMLGYMNKESLDMTLSSGKACFYSRSRETLWLKGETSGNTLMVIDVQKDCDNDTLLLLCQPNGPTCHTGSESCFASGYVGSGGLDFLETTLTSRISSLKEGKIEGYTGRLFSQHEDRLLKKITEEAGEVVLAAKGSDLNALIDECADLLFHMDMVLVSKGLSFMDIRNRLKNRSLEK